MIKSGRKFLEVVEELHECITLRNKMLKKCPELSKFECNLLQFLYNKKDKITMNELAKVQGVSFSRISKVVDRLSELNLCTRIQSEDDRRKFFPVLTLEGEFRANVIDNELLVHQRLVLNLLHDEKIKDIYDSLQVYTRALQKINREYKKEDKHDS